MLRESGLRKWFVATRLDLTPGPTPWHGLSLIDYHPLETARCFMATISIFLLHWAVYRRCVHGVAPKLVRCLLAAAMVVSYLLAVLYLHPWQPYWIRELSVMLSQLFAWKVADLVLFRHGELLPYGFWSWILFDVLVLRPPALVLPRLDGHPTVAAAAVPDGESPSLAAYAPAAAVGCHSGGGAAAAAADAAPRHGLPSGGPRAPQGARKASCGKAPVGLGARGIVANPRSCAQTRPVDSITLHGEPGHHSGGSTRNPSRSSSSSTYSSSSNSSSSVNSASGASGGNAEDSCGRGQQRCGRCSGGTASAPAAAAGVAARAMTAAARTRLAAAVVWGPLLDFLWHYNACEALNAYLMHRRADDILAAPLIVQAWLSACFAATLYFHLQYFFHSMEMLWVVGFALAGGARCERWAPLFNRPERSTSPLDFWNNRWHQAFRWWWTRLVFAPVRSGLETALDRLAPVEGGAGAEGGGGGKAGGDAAAQSAGASSDTRAAGGLGTAAAAAAAALETAPAPADGTPPGAMAHVHGLAVRRTSRGSLGPGTLASGKQVGASGGGGGAGGGGGGGGGRQGQRQLGGERSRRGDGQRCLALWHWLGLGRGPAPPKVQGKKPQRKRSKRRSKRSGGAETAADGRGGDGNGGCADAGAGVGGAGRRRRPAQWWLSRGNRRALLLAVPTVAVFLFSAFFHETLLWINFGRPSGEQAAFFLLHAALMLLQRGAEQCTPQLTAAARAIAPAPLRAAAFMGLTALTSVLFFRPWFRSSYHRELRVLLYGPTGWAVRVWVLGLPPASARLVW